MCGITFFLSKNEENIIEYLLKSLFLIQNRGYDSVGIAYFDDNSNNYNIIKNATTNISDSYGILKNKVISDNINSSIGLGHTRWATHGSKTNNNAHPHISMNENIILVHNGIINNYMDIKIKLLSKGFNFKGETDSEIVANLIEYYLLHENNNIEDAIKNSINELDGTWALVILYTKSPYDIYITRHGSPLLLGFSDELIIISSEVNAFLGLIYNYIIIDNNDIFKINKSEYKSITNSTNKYIINSVKNENIITDFTPSPYPYWTIKEIMEQPETIQKAINYGARILNDDIKLGGLDQLKIQTENIEIDYVIIIGCGTSYHAALLGEKYFNSSKFLAIKAYDACEFTQKNLPNIKNKNKILTIFCSQSGETIDLLNALNICKKENCITLGIINVVDSLIARTVDCGVYLNAGPEIAVASTKSFTSTLIVLSLIAMWFNGRFNNICIINNLRVLPNTITQLLYDFKFLKSMDILSTFIITNNINNIFILGKNKLFPITREISLKMKEICYIHAEGFSSGSLKHGPFALLDKTNLTLLLIDYNDRKNYNNVKSTYNELISRNTNIFTIINSYKTIADLNININNTLLLPKLDYYNEIIFTIALQYLAYNISIEKNIDPDKPKNLAKVVTVA
tara:strand:+ start:35814 stop:37700 length:1887 start_codon:yes stop_codon:yes gene_type:complete